MQINYCTVYALSIAHVVHNCALKRSDVNRRYTADVCGLDQGVSGRGAAGSRGSIDPPLFEVPGPPMQFDPPLLTQSKRAQDCENAVHRHKVKVY